MDIYCQIGKKKNNIPLKENHPYISFNYDEINILQKIKQEKINNKQELKTDLFILQTSIDFLFFFERKRKYYFIFK